MQDRILKATKISNMVLWVIGHSKKNVSVKLALSLPDKQIISLLLHRRSKVSVQNSQAGQHDESQHNFKVVYIHQQVHLPVYWVFYC